MLQKFKTDKYNAFKTLQYIVFLKHKIWKLDLPKYLQAKGLERHMEENGIECPGKINCLDSTTKLFEN